MIQPVCESGTFLDAKDASENARNLRSAQFMGWIVMAVSACLFASCNVLLASINVLILAELIVGLQKA